MSLAAVAGCEVEDIWGHPENRALRERRGHPGLLAEGDVVMVPEAAHARSAIAPGSTKRFRADVPLTKLNLTLVAPPTTATLVADTRLRQEGATKIYEEPEEPARQEEQPMADVAYRLEIAGRVIQGRTDGRGRLQALVPATATRGKLTIDPGGRHELVSEVHVGRLGPIDERSGVLHRLQNLGIVVEHDADDPEKAFAAAISVFQHKYGLTVTGALDAATRDALREKHGI